MSYMGSVQMTWNLMNASHSTVPSYICVSFGEGQRAPFNADLGPFSPINTWSPIEIPHKWYLINTWYLLVFVPWFVGTFPPIYHQHHKSNNKWYLVNLKYLLHQTSLFRTYIKFQNKKKKLKYFLSHPSNAEYKSQKNSNSWTVKNKVKW